MFMFTFTPTHLPLWWALEHLSVQWDIRFATSWTQYFNFGCTSDFFRKKDNSLILCIDYRDFNWSIENNRYPFTQNRWFFLIKKGTTIFLEINLWSKYHQLRINECDISKTSFQTYFIVVETMKFMSLCSGNVRTRFVQWLSRPGAVNWQDQYITWVCWQCYLLMLDNSRQVVYYNQQWLIFQHL